MARRPPERVEPGFGPRPGQPAQPGLTAGERLMPVESTVDQGDSGWGGVAIFLLVAFAAGLAYWWWWSGRAMPWDDPKPVPAAVAPPAAAPSALPAPPVVAPAPAGVTPVPAAPAAAPSPQVTPPPQAIPAAPAAPPPAPSVNRRQPQPAASSLPADMPPPEQRADGYCRDLTIEPAPGSKVTVPLQRRMCWDAKTQSWTTAAVP